MIYRPLTPVSPRARRPGDLVCVPLAHPVGDPGAPLVAVQVKPLASSVTFWTSLALISGAVLDATVEAFLPMLLKDEPLDLEKVWRPLLVAALSAVIAWRRRQQNSVIGSAGA